MMGRMLRRVLMTAVLGVGALGSMSFAQPVGYYYARPAGYYYAGPGYYYGPRVEYREWQAREAWRRHEWYEHHVWRDGRWCWR